MKYELPPDVEQQVRQRVASGQYANEADVLRNALAALEWLPILAWAPPKSWSIELKSRPVARCAWR